MPIVRYRQLSLKRMRNVSLGPFFPVNAVLFFFSLFSQAEGRTLPGIRESCPRSKHPQEASGVASKARSIVAACVERKGKCCIAGTGLCVIAVTGWKNLLLCLLDSCVSGSKALLEDDFAWLKENA